MSRKFTHIFQLKFVGGDSKTPVATFSGATRSGVSYFEVRHTAFSEMKNNVLVRIPWDHITGIWVNAVVEVNLFPVEMGGHLKVSISRTDGGQTLLETDVAAGMWRPGNEFLRPKWGIYRQSVHHLISKGDLNDATVYFTDFCIQNMSALVTSQSTLSTGTTLMTALTEDMIKTGGNVMLEATPDVSQRQNETRSPRITTDNDGDAAPGEIWVESSTTSSMLDSFTTIVGVNMTDTSTQVAITNDPVQVTAKLIASASANVSSSSMYSSKTVGLGCAESWTSWLENDPDTVQGCAKQIGEGACPEGSSDEYFLWRSFGVPNCGCVQAGFADTCPVGEDGWDGEVALHRRPITVKWMFPVEPQTLKIGVGATISFSWNGYHDVYEFATVAAFDLCNFDEAVLLSDSSSTFELKIDQNLTVARYFGCSRPGHCANGQKLKLIVEDKTTTTLATTTSEISKIDTDSNSDRPTTTITTPSVSQAGEMYTNSNDIPTSLSDSNVTVPSALSIAVSTAVAVSITNLITESATPTLTTATEDNTKKRTASTPKETVIASSEGVSFATTKSATSPKQTGISSGLKVTTTSTSTSTSTTIKNPVLGNTGAASFLTVNVICILFVVFSLMTLGW